MSDVPLLNYPLFAIQLPDGTYTAIGGPSPRDGARISAIAVWTHEAIAQAFCAALSCGGALVTIPTPMTFRVVLCHQGATVFGVAFDPYVREGQITTRWFGEIDDVLEALPAANFMWTYPVFAVRTGEGQFAALGGSTPDGAPSVGLAVFTDEDLALRYIEAMQLPSDVQSLATALEFRDFLRTQSADGVCFDPVSTGHGPKSRFHVAKASLLSDLPAD